MVEGGAITLIFARNACAGNGSVSLDDLWAKNGVQGASMGEPMEIIRDSGSCTVNESL